MADIKSLFKDLHFILRFTVAIILLVAVVLRELDVTTLGSAKYHTYVLYVVGVILHLIVFIAFVVLHVADQVHQLYALIHLIFGGVVNCLLGVFCLVDGDSKDALIIIILALAAGVIMIVDFVFEIIGKSSSS